MIMQFRLLTHLLLLSTITFSCQNKNNGTQLNKKVHAVDTPDWQANKVLEQISETISLKPFEKRLILKLVATAQSIETGEFQLELEWLNEKHFHEIQLPIVPGQFYGIPYLSKHPDKPHTFEIGYINTEGVKKEIYEVAIINNNLHFKQTQVFQLIQSP